MTLSFLFVILQCLVGAMPSRNSYRVTVFQVFCYLSVFVWGLVVVVVVVVCVCVCVCVCVYSTAVRFYLTSLKDL